MVDVTKPVFVRVGDAENQVGEVTVGADKHAVAELLRDVADEMDTEHEAWLARAVELADEPDTE